MEKKNIYEFGNHKQNTIYHSAFNQINENYNIRYDVISQEFEIKKKNEKEWYELNINSLLINLNQGGLTIAYDKLNVLLNSDMIERYNPVEYYFKNLPNWDNFDHIGKLASYVPPLKPEEFKYHLTKWMVRAVKCALEDGYFNKQCFILMDRGQSGGKTSWCRYLSPPKLKNFFAENIGTDKDSKIKITSNFLINLDELAELEKKDVNALKSMFSIESINERRPYAKKSSIIQRICSFVGSTNEDDFLTDASGSVRWLVFELNGNFNFNYTTEVDIDLVWSQAYHLAYKDKAFNPELTREDIEANEIRNSQFAKLTTEQELIAKYYEKSNDMNDFVTPTEVLIKLNCLNLRLNAGKIGKAFSGFKFDRPKHSKRQVYGYLAKCKFIDSPWELELKK